MSVVRHSETAFGTVIETHLLENGYVPGAREGFDRNRAIFPETALTFIRETQPKEWARLWSPCTATEPESSSSGICASGWTSTARLPRCDMGSSATVERSARRTSRPRTN